MHHHLTFTDGHGGPRYSGRSIAGQQRLAHRHNRRRNNTRSFGPHGLNLTRRHGKPSRGSWASARKCSLRHGRYGIGGLHVHERLVIDRLVYIDSVIDIRDIHGLNDCRVRDVDVVEIMRRAVVRRRVNFANSKRHPAQTRRSAANLNGDSKMGSTKPSHQCRRIHRTHYSRSIRHNDNGFLSLPQRPPEYKPIAHSGRVQNPTAHRLPRSSPTVQSKPNVRNGMAPNQLQQLSDTRRAHIRRHSANRRMCPNLRNPPHCAADNAPMPVVPRAHRDPAPTNQNHPAAAPVPGRTPNLPYPKLMRYCQEPD